jgi:hypothetical protein
MQPTIRHALEGVRAGPVIAAQWRQTQGACHNLDTEG